MNEHAYILKWAWHKLYQRYMKGFLPVEEAQDIVEKVRFCEMFYPYHQDISYLRERVMRVMRARGQFDLGTDWPYLPDVPHFPTYIEICKMVDEGILVMLEKGVVESKE